MVIIDGISGPRAYKLSKNEGTVVLQFREQMSDFDIDAKSVSWKPRAGPCQILKNVLLDKQKCRLVPRKPVPLDGLRIHVQNLEKHSKLGPEHIQVGQFSHDIHNYSILLTYIGME
jgi:hypothetical protein